MAQTPLVATDGGEKSGSNVANPDGETVVVVGCGSKKADSKRPARDLYTSTYFEKKREYAEIIGDSWTILSAKYGSLDPTGAYVGPYNLTITDYPIDTEEYPDARYETLEEWAEGFLSGVENRVHNYERWDDHAPLGQLVMLVGQKYLDPLRDGLDELADRCGFEVRTPFEGTSGNGEQMKWLNIEVEKARTEGDTSEDGTESAKPENTSECNDSAMSNNGTDDQEGLDFWSS